MLSRFCFIVFLAVSFGAQAVDTSADEARIDDLVAELSAGMRKTATPSLYGEDPGTLVAENPAAASSGSESVAVPIDEPAVVDNESTDTLGTEPALDAGTDPLAADTPAAETAEPPTDAIGKGPVTFDQLSKLIGRRIRIQLLSGRRYEGELNTVTDAECRISVRMYGTGVTVMPIKKAHISTIELL